MPPIEPWLPPVATAMPAAEALLPAALTAPAPPLEGVLPANPGVPASDDSLEFDAALPHASALIASQTHSADLRARMLPADGNQPMFFGSLCSTRQSASAIGKTVSSDAQVPQIPVRPVAE
jgi:hypothetical protein